MKKHGCKYFSGTRFDGSRLFFYPKLYYLKNKAVKPLTLNLHIVSNLSEEEIRKDFT